MTVKKLSKTVFQLEGTKNTPNLKYNKKQSKMINKINIKSRSIRKGQIEKEMMSRRMMMSKQSQKSAKRELLEADMARETREPKGTLGIRMMTTSLRT